MLRIVLCCQGGGSSGYLTLHLRKQLEEQGLGERASFSFMAFGGLAKYQDRYDIAMICPHQEYEIKMHAADFHIPVYVIPMVMYGTMPAEYLIEDAEDLMEVWKAGGAANPITFPDEPRSMTCGRTVSHRRAKGAKR